MRLWRILAEPETRAKQPAPDQGGRASSRAANTQGTIDLGTIDPFRRSTETHTRLRRLSGNCRARTRSLPAAPKPDQANRRIRHLADTKTT
jgi:hypothetical protein